MTRPSAPVVLDHRLARSSSITLAAEDLTLTTGTFGPMVKAPGRLGHEGRVPRERPARVRRSLTSPRAGTTHTTVESRSSGATLWDELD
jgi:hypothetical protein